jgi:hypothetical protein
MSELINKVNCPNGCQNAIFTESVKIIKENSYQLLNESQNQQQQVKRIKVYNCTCCGSTFEVYQKDRNNLIF